MLLQRRFKSLFLLAVILSLTACGFALRGSGTQQSIPFKTIFLGFPDNSPLGVELRRYIRAGEHTTVVTERKDAEEVLEVIQDAREKNILTLNTQGRVREYSLVYRFSFRVVDAKGAVLLPPTAIALKRDLSFNESQVIAKEKEEEILYRDMQSDLVQQILRRLAAIKPAA